MEIDLNNKLVYAEKAAQSMLPAGCHKNRMGNLGTPNLEYNSSSYPGRIIVTCQDKIVDNQVCRECPFNPIGTGIIFAG